MTQTEEKITFEQMSQLLAELKGAITSINDKLDALLENGSTPSDTWMDLDAFRAYHPDKPARATVHEWVNLKKIPVHKDGKRLRFLKSEIDEWLCKGRRMPQEKNRPRSILLLRDCREMPKKFLAFLTN